MQPLFFEFLSNYLRGKEVISIFSLFSLKRILRFWLQSGEKCVSMNDS